MKKVILKCMFRGTPHFLDLIMTENEAKDLIKKWTEGEGRRAYNYDKEQDRHYAIAFSEICAMFTQDLERLKEQLRQQQSNSPSQPPSHPIFGKSSSN